jgi:hypothetical protein
MMQAMRGYPSVTALVLDTKDRLESWQGIIGGLELFFQRVKGQDFKFSDVEKQLARGVLNLLTGCIKRGLEEMASALHKREEESKGKADDSSAEAGGSSKVKVSQETNNKYMWIVTALLAPVFGPRELKKLIRPITSYLTSQLPDKIAKVVNSLIHAMEIIEALVEQVGGAKGIAAAATDFAESDDKAGLVATHKETLFQVLDELKVPPQAKVALQGLFGLAQRDLEAVGAMAVELGGFDKQKMEALIRMVESAMKLAGQFKEKVADLADDDEQDDDDEPVDESEEDAQMALMFRRFDKDNSGNIDFYEFLDLAKHMNINLSHHKAVELFAAVDADGSGVLEFTEFADAMGILKEQAATKTLERLGLSTDRLIFIFAALCLLLMALLGFVFAGISAFTEGSGFGAVVNSIMPLAFGGALGSGAPGGDEAQDSGSLKKNVKKSMDGFKAQA